MTNPTPARLRRSRAKGSKLVSPNGLPVVSVTRPGKWGNPFRADVFGLETSLKLYRETVKGGWHPGHVAHLSDELCDLAYKLKCEWLQNFRAKWGGSPFDALHLELRGCNVSCWCPLPAPGAPDKCHAAILLELANPDLAQPQQREGRS